MGTKLWVDYKSDGAPDGYVVICTSLNDIKDAIEQSETKIGILYRNMKVLSQNKTVDETISNLCIDEININECLINTLNDLITWLNMSGRVGYNIVTHKDDTSHVVIRKVKPDIHHEYEMDGPVKIIKDKRPWELFETFEDLPSSCETCRREWKCICKYNHSGISSIISRPEKCPLKKID